MRLRTIWEFFALLLVLFAVAHAVTTHSVGRMLVLVMCGALLGALTAWTTVETMELDDRWLTVRATWWGILTGAAIAGWVGALGPWGMLPVVVAVVTFPDLVDRLTRRLRGRSRDTATRVHRMSDAELKQRWDATTQQLLRPQRPTAVAALAEERSCILDEVGQRNPAELTRWLGGEHSWEGLL